MANEFKHGTVGTELTQTEWEGIGTHVLDSQATGDIVYAASSSQLRRLGIGSTGAVLTVTGGVPAWDTTWTPTGDLIPSADDTYDLGSAAAAWQDLFLEGDITMTDAGTIETSASQTLLTAATWLQTAAMTALNIAMGPIGLIIIGIVAAIAGIILAIKNWDKITAAFSKVWDTAWSTIKRVFEPVVDFIEGVIDGPFGWLLPGGSLIKGLRLLRDNWDTIWNGMKATVSLVVDGIKGYVNLLIGALNLMIRGANKIKIEVPKWVPKIGGKGWSLNIPEIPSLAAGGIVTSPTLAMIGERGPEAVIPLNKAGGGGITINILGPTYGFDDFEEKVSEAITDGVRRGGFSGILATA